MKNLKKTLISIGAVSAGLLLGACANNAQSNNNSNSVSISASTRRANSNNSKLGPVVGHIDGKPIRANQLLRNSNWNGGYNTPSDGKDTNRDHKATKRITKKAKSLIIYWSRSGSTELLASKIAKRTHADIYEIRLQNPYPANYQKTLKRANDEREQGRPPKVIRELPSLKQYNKIYIGYQTWAMTLSQPFQGFLRQYGNRFSGKIIAPFETEGGYGQGDSVDVMRDIIREEGGRNNTFASDLVVDGNKVNRPSTTRRVNNWVRTVQQMKK